MDNSNQRPRSPPGLQQPGGRAGGKRVVGGKKKNPALDDTAKHAAEVRDILRGRRDFVDKLVGKLETAPAPFSNDLLMVRSWTQKRPFEAPTQAAALVHFPRLWSTKRGRYCRFATSASRGYGLLRARPSFI